MRKAWKLVPGLEDHPLLEHAVVGQLHLAVHVPHLSPGKVESGVDDDARLFFHRRPGDDVDPAAQFFQLPPFMTARLQGGVGGDVLQLVAAQAQLREHDELLLFPDGAGDLVGMELQVFFDVSQAGAELHGSDLHGPNIAQREGGNNPGVAPAAPHGCLSQNRASRVTAACPERVTGGMKQLTAAHDCDIFNPLDGRVPKESR